MVPITALWMPILLSAVIVFVASSILHMVLPYHKSDYRKLPDEDKVVDALRAAGVVPAMGKYLGMWFVYCVVVSTVVAFVAGTTLSAGTRYPVVFHLTGLAALLAYGVGQLQDSIWKGQT